jgi:putative addiction module component (TIGR02574 family)
MARLEIDINKLSPEERLDLIAELWDSLSTDSAKPLTGPRANELDRRWPKWTRMTLWAPLGKQFSRAFVP